MISCPNCGHHHTPCSDSAALSRIEGDLAKLLTSVKRLTTMSEDVNSELAAEAAQETALAVAVAANTTTLQNVQAQLAAALAGAKASGLTADQLAAFDAIHVKVSADLDALAAADAPEASPT